MTLADLTYAYNPVSGGVRTYIDAKREYIREFTDWNHLLIIPGEEDSVAREGRLATVRIKAPTLPVSPSYRLIFRLAAVVDVLRRFSPEVIELGSLYTLPWAAFRYRRERPVAISGFYHTDLADAYVRPVMERTLGRFIGGAVVRGVYRYVRAVYSRCDTTLTASPALVSVLKAMGIPRVQHTNLGVDLDTWNPTRADPQLRRELHIASDARLLVYVGRLDAEKRVKMLCDAVMQMPDTLPAVLLFVGQGPQAEDLRSFAEDTRRIRVLPFESDKLKLARVVASADAYLAGNPNETFGLSVVEAQAAGLPVVGVRAGALIERIPPELGELCEPDDAGSMAEAIAKLFGRSDLSKIPGAAREHVAQRFNWKTSLDHIFGIYTTLVGKTLRPQLAD